MVQIQINATVPEDIKEDFKDLERVFDRSPEGLVLEAIEMLIRIRILDREAEFVQSIIDHSDQIVQRVTSMPSPPVEPNTLARVRDNWWDTAPSYELYLSEYQLTMLQKIAYLDDTNIPDVIDGAIRLLIQRTIYDNPESYRRLDAAADERVRTMVRGLIFAIQAHPQRTRGY